MFERFTKDARNVVLLAEGDARALGHNYVGTEHILLGLLADADGVAARALASLGLTADEVRSETTATVGRGPGALDPEALAAIGIDFDEVRRRVEEAFGADALARTRAGCGRAGRRPPFTPRAKKVLERALREARSLRHDHIAGEHILLGLLLEHEGLAVKIMRRRGLSPERVREAVLTALSTGAEGR